MQWGDAHREKLISKPSFISFNLHDDLYFIMWLLLTAAVFWFRINEHQCRRSPHSLLSFTRVYRGSRDRCMLFHSNLTVRRNQVLGVAFVHQTRAPSPRVGVQSNKSGLFAECAFVMRLRA